MKNKDKSKKEKLNYIEKDSEANYDIDGVSYDGDDVHVSGDETHESKKKPKKSRDESSSLARS